MFNTLPQDVKASISQSISTGFKQYMKRIEWDDNKYNKAEFKNEWWNQAKQAPWYDKVDHETLESPTFKEEVSEEIDEISEKIFKEEPTEELEDELEGLIKKLNHKKINYCSKTEVEFYIERLKNM